MHTNFIVARWSQVTKGLIYLTAAGRETGERADAAVYSRAVAECVLIARVGQWSVVGVRA